MSRKIQPVPVLSTEFFEEETTGANVSVPNLMEEKHVYTYKKLVVPMSMRSIYWKYFGFPATDDGSILTKVKIVCILCKTQIAYNRNTSNLRMHLQNKHAQELLELETANPPRKPIISQEAKERRAQKRLLKAGLAAAQHIYTTNTDGTIQLDSGIQFVTDPSVNLTGIEEDVNVTSPVRVMIKNQNNSCNLNSNVAFLMSDDTSVQHCGTDSKSAILDAIAEFVIVDLQLPEIVEGRGFQKLVATLKSPCEIPSKSKLEDDLLPKIYDSYKESIAQNLSCLNTEVGLAIEEWRSNAKENFVTFSTYYQHPGETILDYKVLCTLHAPDDWDEIQWGIVIDSLLAEWDLRIERITAAVIAISIPGLITALNNRGLTLIPCLLHSLQICALACFHDSDVAPVISKCRAIIGVILGHNGASATLAMQDQILELEENSLVMDYPSVWISTYNMLEQLSLRRTVLSNVLDAVERADHDVIDLTQDEWKLIEDLVTVLEPFKVTIMTVGEEKIPLISLLKPLLWQLVSSHLKAKETDSSTTRNFKENLSDMLCERYADSNVTLLLQIATTLDPRFKQLPYATDEDKTLVSAPIKDMLTKLIEEEGGNRIIKTDDIPDKKRRMSRMEQLLGDQFCNAKSRMPSEEKADLELVQYQSEATAALDHCPLQWWANNVAKCPHLSKLAQKYNCVPACCPPPSRISAEAQVLYDTKRAALPSHLVDKLLFLYGNYNVSE